MTGIMGYIQLYINGSLETQYAYRSITDRQEKPAEWRKKVTPLLNTGRQIIIHIKPNE